MWGFLLRWLLPVAVSLGAARGVQKGTERVAWMVLPIVGGVAYKWFKDR